MSPTWLRQRVRKYATLVGLGYVPKVVFSQRDWQRAVPRRHWRETHGNIAGLALSKQRAIYISLNSACCRRSSDDLCAHEVTHLRWPNLRHGRAFEHRVSELRLGRLP